MICIIVLALVGSVLRVPALYPQPTTDVATKLDRVTGTVQSINREKSTITVQQAELYSHTADNRSASILQCGGTRDRIQPCRSTVSVAQLAELWIVAPAAGGSNPLAHPTLSHSHLSRKQTLNHYCPVKC
jgi:hypothetical protein